MCATMSSMSIQVNIRLESESKSKPFCVWPATNLDRLIPTIKAWGVHDEESNDWSDDISGSFHLGEGNAFFEVIVHDLET